LLVIDKRLVAYSQHLAEVTLMQRSTISYYGNPKITPFYSFGSLSQTTLLYTVRNSEKFGHDFLNICGIFGGFFLPETKGHIYENYEI
jgi:hypothetical protein